jgi:hypothetical protein
MGRANIIVPSTKYKVPIIAGNMPPSLIPIRGIEVKNSQEIAPIPFLMIITTIRATGIITNRLAKNKKENAILWVDL